MLVVAVVTLLAAPRAQAALLKATYLFNDNLNAEEVGAPALVAVDPLGMNQFETATVFSQTRRVYHYDGNASPSTQQAGLSLDTTGLIPTDNYSVEIVYEFLQDTFEYRRILDVENRASDHGFYVEPGDHLQVFPVATGSTIFTSPGFHHVALTDAPAATDTVKAYLDGNLEFTTLTNVMRINNVGDLMNFFLDNNVGLFQDEYVDGRVALIRVWEGVLTDSEVQQLARNPFPQQVIPEPGTVTLLLIGLGVVGIACWRKKKVAE
jgi:hypothetical protein